MDWLKKHYDRVILAVIGLLVLAFAAMIILDISSFGERFESRNQVKPPNNTLPAPPTALVKQRTESLKSPAEWGAHEGSLFVSEPFISANGGEPENLFREGSQPIFPPVPNDWIVKYSIDFSDPNLLNADPDGDKFTNLEEYLGKTDPQNAKSKPGYISKMRLLQWVKEPFRLKFGGSPDGGQTFTINTLDLNQPTQFLKLGEMVKGTPYKLLSFDEKHVMDNGLNRDVSELTVENTENGEKIALIYDKVVDSPTQYALFKYLWDGSEFKVKKLDTFSVEPEKSTPYKLIDISDNEAVIENTKTKEQIHVPKDNP